MKTLINQFVAYLGNDEFKRRLDSYSRLIKTNEWQFFKDVLISIKGEMMVDLLSHKFTNLDATEKDVVQQTYFQINQILDFLSDPQQWVRKKTIKQKTYDLASKVKPSQGKGQTK